MATLRAWWQQLRERRATRYLTQYHTLAADVLRLHPDLAVTTMQRVLEAAGTAPQRDTMAYPVLSSFGYGGSSALLRTLPKTVPFAIRRFSEYPPARRAIQAIVQPIVDMPWHIVPRAAIGSDEHVKTAITADQQTRIVALTETLLNPNNEQSGRQLFEMLLEDLVVFGGGCAEVQPNRSDDRPVFLFPVDAQSIRINMEWRPGNRTFRYSQGKGYVFGAMGVTDDVKLRDDELLYMKLNNRTHTPFGFGYLETAFDCYSADTEVLTKRGWIAWPAATGNDQFATRDPLTGMFEWQSPLKMHKVHRAGEMIHFKSQSTDMLVSPNHRMFGRRVARDGSWRKRGDSTTLYGDCEFLRADLVADLPSVSSSKGCSGFQVPLRSSWKGQYCPETITLSVEKGKRGNTPASYTIPFTDWVAFLGIYVAEGSASGTKTNKEWKKSRHYKVDICQSESSPHRSMIRDLLSRMPMQWTEHKHGFYCVSKALHAAVFPLGDSYQKYVPECVKDAPADVIRLFIEWACRGDGSVRETGLLSYGTASKQLADDMQELFQKAGSSASVSCYTRKPGPLPAGRYNYNPSTIYYVMEHRSSFDGIGQATRVDYDDYIYCATVPNETLYVRRHGKAMWCGNTVNAFVGAFQYAERRASNNTPNFGIFLGENVTVDQVRRWQHYWENEIEGYGKVPILGGGRQPSVFNMTGTGEDQLWLRWQEFLIRVIGMSFGLSPMKLGLMQDVNRSTAQESSANDWATMAPVANTLGNALTHYLLWRRLSWKDLEFQWQVRTTDEMRQAEVLMEQYRMNGITVDEIRQFYGRPPLEDGLGDLTKTSYEMAVKAAAMGAVGVGGPEHPMGHNNISGMTEVITPFDDDPDTLQPHAKAWMRDLLRVEAEARRNG